MVTGEHESMCMKLLRRAWLCQRQHTHTQTVAYATTEAQNSDSHLSLFKLFSSFFFIPNTTLKVQYMENCQKTVSNINSNK